MLNALQYGDSRTSRSDWKLLFRPAVILDAVSESADAFQIDDETASEQAEARDEAEPERPVRGHFGKQEENAGERRTQEGEKRNLPWTEIAARAHGMEYRARGPVRR
jgi:hypothetical protein